MSIIPMPVSSGATALKQLNIEGPLIPFAWYRHIKRESGQTDIEAIFILAHIVDDYCPVQILEDEVDQVIGYCHEFKDVLLQKSYQDYMNVWGFSKDQVINVFERLEQLGLLRRIFRMVKTSKKSMVNMMFIKINAEKIEEFSRPSDIDEREVN